MTTYRKSRKTSPIWIEAQILLVVVAAFDTQSSAVSSSQYVENGVMFDVRPMCGRLEDYVVTMRTFHG